MNRRDGFKTMSAKVIVLLKRDLNYKPRFVSNEEWGKKVWIFLGLSVRGNLDKTRLSLPPLLSRILWGSLPFVDDPFQFVFWISSYFILTWLLARYSPLYLCLFLFSSAFLSPYSAYFSVFSNFLVRFFSTRFTPFTSCFLWLLSLSCQPISLKTLSPRTWIKTISSAWQSF